MQDKTHFCPREKIPPPHTHTLSLYSNPRLPVCPFDVGTWSKNVPLRGTWRTGACASESGVSTSFPVPPLTWNWVFWIPLALCKLYSNAMVPISDAAFSWRLCGHILGYRENSVLWKNNPSIHLEEPAGVCQAPPFPRYSSRPWQWWRELNRWYSCPCGTYVPIQKARKRTITSHARMYLELRRKAKRGRKKEGRRGEWYACAHTGIHISYKLTRQGWLVMWHSAEICWEHVIY